MNAMLPYGQPPPSPSGAMRAALLALLGSRQSPFGMPDHPVVGQAGLYGGAMPVAGMHFAPGPAAQLSAGYGGLHAPTALPAQHPAGGGPQADPESGLAPPWPGAVVAVYDPVTHKPIYYGTAAWTAYQLRRGRVPFQEIPSVPRSQVQPFVNAILSQLGQQASGALGHGAVID